MFVVHIGIVYVIIIILHFRASQLLAKQFIYFDAQTMFCMYCCNTVYWMYMFNSGLIFCVTLKTPSVEVYYKPSELKTAYGRSYDAFATACV